MSNRERAAVVQVRGGILYYPIGSTRDATDGTSHDNKAIAEQMLAKLAVGEDVALPSCTDEHGNRLWHYEPGVLFTSNARAAHTGDE